jgi:aerobic carbon-monoxide dehydrogenase small subunit
MTMKNSHISIDLNGKPTEMLVPPGTSLLAALRDTLRFTATRKGCEQGGCGACTVIVNGMTVLSCIVPIETINGAKVETVEGLSTGNDLHPIQRAFLDGFATQCGFCTGGMMMAIKGLLAENSNPSRSEVIQAISGNICRCTGYESIIEAALDAAILGKKSKSKAA